MQILGFHQRYANLSQKTAPANPGLLQTSIPSFLVFPVPKSIICLRQSQKPETGQRGKRVEANCECHFPAFSKSFQLYWF